MKNTFLFIDGSNLYSGQFELFGPKKYLNFSQFIREIEKNLKISFLKIYFYASYSPIPKNPSKKEKLYLKNEALFYKNVKNTKNVIFFTGYRSKTSGKEKEVDVKLATDLVAYAFLKKYDEVFLMTGDADFLQALLTIKKYHPEIKIKLLCFENKIMYKGMFRFIAYITQIVREPILYNKSKNLKKIIINNKKVIIDI
ncbi:MAG: hypothetical protein Fur009_2090 [Candidatus Microgenomates bacterium]